jgi:predicted phosphodiesterase
MARVLVIGDTHAPAMHHNYVPFLKSVAATWKTDTVVHIGDVVDNHSISFHDKHPQSDGVVEEYEKTLDQVSQLYKAFPKTIVTIGNHDLRIKRVGAKSNIAQHYFKSFTELYKTPKWKWADNVEIDGVYYYHGEGVGGIQPAFNAAKMRMQSTVIGHYHSACGVWYQAGPTAKIWGMNVGSGVDHKHNSMQYSANFLKKPILACGVVINGTPFVETMNL